MRIRRAAALALVLPCAGCWEEVHYEPPPATVAATPEAVPPTVNPGHADPGVATADPTSVTLTPSGDELFANDPPLAIEPTAQPPVAADATPIVAPPQQVDAPTALQRQAAWTLASNWALVAAMQARGLGADRYESYLAAAGGAGDSLGVAVPPLPAGGTPTKLEETIIEDLQIGAGPKLADSIAARLDEAAGAAARLAIRSHLLLLTYTPAGSTVWGDAADIRDAGVASGLPPELWRPLIEQLERRADFIDVRKAVFTLRDSVSAHLAE